MTVYQVQAIDPRGRVRIVHSYETAEQARLAVKTMRALKSTRYDIVPVLNDATQYWGLDEG